MIEPEGIMSEDRRPSEVIRFPVRDASGPSRTGARREGGGTVLLFTGVRYEREAEPTVSPALAPALAPPPGDRAAPAGDRRVGA